jgi:hypothetical protein
MLLTGAVVRGLQTEPRGARASGLLSPQPCNLMRVCCMLRHGSFVASCEWRPCRVAHWLSSAMLRACCCLCAARCSPRTNCGSAVRYPLQLACVSTLHASSSMSSAVCCTSSAICCLLHSARCLLVAILCVRAVACCTLLCACCTRSFGCCCVRCIMHAAIMHAAFSLAHLAWCQLRVAGRLLCTLSVALVVECPHVVCARCTLFVLCCMSFTVACCPTHRRMAHVFFMLCVACCTLSVMCCMLSVARRMSVACRLLPVAE